MLFSCDLFIQTLGIYFHSIQFHMAQVHSLLILNESWETYKIHSESFPCNFKRQLTTLTRIQECRARKGHRMYRRRCTSVVFTGTSDALYKHTATLCTVLFWFGAGFTMSFKVTSLILGLLYRHPHVSITTLMIWTTRTSFRDTNHIKRYFPVIYLFKY